MIRVRFNGTFGWPKGAGFQVEKTVMQLSVLPMLTCSCRLVRVAANDIAKVQARQRPPPCSSQDRECPCSSLSTCCHMPGSLDLDPRAVAALEGERDKYRPDLNSFVCGAFDRS